MDMTVTTERDALLAVEQALRVLVGRVRPDHAVEARDALERLDMVRGRS